MFFCKVRFGMAKRIFIGIVGTDDGLLMNPRLAESPPRNPKPKEEAEKRVIRDPEGRICLRNDHLYGVLVNAGKKVQLKARRNVTPSKGPSSLYSFLKIDQRFLPLTNGTPGEEPTWEVSDTYSKNPEQQQVRTIRPLFPKWGLEFSVTVDDSKISLQKVRELCDTAGDESLGSWRGRYGKFRVVKWEVVDLEPKAA